VGPNLQHIIVSLTFWVYCLYRSEEDLSFESDSSDSDGNSDDNVTASLRPTIKTVGTVAKDDAMTAPTTTTQAKPRNRKRGKKNKGHNGSDSESGLSDDDINSSSAALKTEHEVEAVIEAPKIDSIPVEYEILPFGKVSSVIDTVVVVKADTGGDWRVLDEGSLCCWEDRTVIGNVGFSFSLFKNRSCPLTS
jgi:hypothetical protein